MIDRALLGVHDPADEPKMSDLIANIVGSAAAVCSITSFAPQAIKI